MITNCTVPIFTAVYCTLSVLAKHVTCTRTHTHVHARRQTQTHSRRARCVNLILSKLPVWTSLKMSTCIADHYWNPERARDGEQAKSEWFIFQIYPGKWIIFSSISLCMMIPPHLVRFSYDTLDWTKSDVLTSRGPKKDGHHPVTLITTFCL